MFYYQCTCWNARVFDITFRLTQIYSLLESKTQILLLKNLSQISLHILLKSLILACCKNKPISSGKKFITPERAFVLFYLAAVLVGIMLVLTQSNKEDGQGSFFTIVNQSFKIFWPVSFPYNNVWCVWYIVSGYNAKPAFLFQDLFANLNTFTLWAELHL